MLEIIARSVELKPLCISAPIQLTLALESSSNDVDRAQVLSLNICSREGDVLLAVADSQDDARTRVADLLHNLGVLHKHWRLQKELGCQLCYKRVTLPLFEEALTTLSDPEVQKRLQGFDLSAVKLVLTASTTKSFRVHPGPSTETQASFYLARHFTGQELADVLKRTSILPST